LFCNSYDGCDVFITSGESGQEVTSVVLRDDVSVSDDVGVSGDVALPDDVGLAGDMDLPGDVGLDSGLDSFTFHLNTLGFDGEVLLSGDLFMTCGSIVSNLFLTFLVNTDHGNVWPSIVESESVTSTSVPIVFNTLVELLNIILSVALSLKGCMELSK